jgi:hypothetical protein
MNHCVILIVCINLSRKNKSRGIAKQGSYRGIDKISISMIVSSRKRERSSKIHTLFYRPLLNPFVVRILDRSDLDEWRYVSGQSVHR